MLSSRSLRLAFFALMAILAGIWVRGCYLPPALRVLPSQPAPALLPLEDDQRRSRNPDE